MPGLKKGMDFTGLVWKRAWIITFFGLKLGQDLKNWVAHTHQEFLGVPSQVFLVENGCYTRVKQLLMPMGGILKAFTVFSVR